MTQAAQKQSKFTARIVAFRAAKPTPKEKCYRDRCNCGLEHVRLQPATAAPVPAESPDATISASADVSLGFPFEAMYGRLGELARRTEMPLGLGYPALLGCF